MTDIAPLERAALLPGIGSRIVRNINGLDIHLLEAGYGSPSAEMPSAAQIAACRWLPENELAVYSAEYERTGFQSGLQWYRSRTEGRYDSELQLFSGRTIDVPSMFIAGNSDWGT